jgi:hypothetical protein
MIFDHQSRTGRRPLAAGSLDRDSGLVAALRRHEPRAGDALVDTYGGRAELPRPQYEKHAEPPGHDGRLTSKP